MTTEKNLSLLRPFNPKDFKPGDKICTAEDDEPSSEVYVFKNGEVCVLWPSTPNVVAYKNRNTSHLRMAPVGWLETKPVYPGDVVYYKSSSIIPKGLRGQPRIVNKAYAHHPGALVFEGINEPWSPIEGLTWTGQVTRVKKTGWLNVYPDRRVFHDTRKIADANAADNRLACMECYWEQEE